MCYLNHASQLNIQKPLTRACAEIRVENHKRHIMVNFEGKMYEMY